MGIPEGSRLGRFEILSKVGSGGMGEIYLGRDDRLGRRVAIKVLPAHLQHDEDARTRFEREAMALSSLNHPHIITIHELGEEDVDGQITHFMVTEFIDGETLRDYLAKEKDGPKILYYMAQVADALAKAHAAGIVHRDLKPENVMITSDGYAKVLDFGLVKRMPTTATLAAVATNTRFQTHEGLFLGTLGYVSPEQARGAPVDHRSDIFSFGCILYESLSGRRPFEAEGLIDTLHLVLHARHDPLPEDIPREIRRVVDKCLSKTQELRYASMKLIANDIRQGTRAFTLPFSGSGTARKVRSRTARTSARVRSIAVLPFTNTSDDPEMDYLSDGLTESIILSLSQIRKLKVMARSTVFSYKAKQITPQQVGAELHVHSVITGRAHRMGDDLIVHIELVSARDGAHIWGNRYRRQFTEVFEIQEEIATQISEHLKLQLSQLDRQKLARRPTKRAEAYELYLKGRFHANKRTSDGVRRAAQYYEDAIAVDPKYALAYSGMADCYAILSSRALAPPEEGYARVAAAAKKAIELDPTLGEPHATMASLEFLYHWDWVEAEHEFRMSLDLNPNYPTAHHWFSIYLTWMGRHDEAITEARAALDLDPLSLLLNVHLADMFFMAGQLTAAVDQCLRAIDLDQNFFLGHFMLGRIREAQRESAAAVASYERAIALEGRYPETLAGLACSWAATGDAEAARTILDELRIMSMEEFVSPLFFAEIQFSLGREDAALQALEKFFRQRGELELVLVGPRFVTLREDPRFTEMLKRVGFPGTPTLPVVA